MQDQPTRHDAPDTQPRCARRYDSGAGRHARCDGPMAPMRRPGTWACKWCGKVEVAR